MMQGIDISHYQVVNDWTAVAEHADFCFIKASQGLKVDPMYATHRSRSESAGIVTGAYHFLNRAEPAADQAHTFLAAAFPLDHLLLAVDIEHRAKDNSDPTYAQLLDFVGVVSDSIGKNPVVYTNVNWWRAKLGEAAFPRGCPLWVARWAEGYGELPTGWPTPHFWQFTDRLPVAGIKNPVDGDVFYGGMHDLEAVRV
jgi:lysozyme